MRRRIDPLYLASAALAIITVIVLIATTTGPSATTTRTGSINDDGPGGATALRRYLEAMGATTTTSYKAMRSIPAARTCCSCSARASS